MVDIATIGSLTSITKTVIDSLKGLRDLTGEKSNRATSDFDQAFSDHQKRIKMLAVQLEQVELLGRMLPSWLTKQSKLKAWADNPTDDHLRSFDTELRDFVNDSIRDSLSSLFFAKSFEHLPSVLAILVELRKDLHKLDESVRSVPRADVASWRAMLPRVNTRLDDLFNIGQELERHADKLRVDLIDELKDAADIGIDSLEEPAGNR